jgi:hypothetical protein
VIGKDRMQPTTPRDDRLPLLLEICEDHFAHIGPNGYYEVDALLRGHDITGGPGWLIDMLAAHPPTPPGRDPNSRTLIMEKHSALGPEETPIWAPFPRPKPRG